MIRQPMLKLLSSIRLFSFFFLGLLFSNRVNSQADIQLPYTEISTIKFAEDIWKNSKIFYADKEPAIEDLSKLNPIQKWVQKRKILPAFVSKKPVLIFNLRNSGDTACSVYFFPGRYFQGITIYKVSSNKITQVPDILPPQKNNPGYRKITLNAKDSAVFYAILKPLKTYTNNLRPVLINDIYITSFIANEQNYKPFERLFTLIICGLLLMMILFSLINFFQGANKEFFHYAGYALFLGVMLFLKALIGFHTNRLNFFMEGYFDFILFCTGHLFYLGFIQRFLDTKRKHHFIHKLCNTGIIALIIAMISYTLLHYSDSSYTPEYYIENVTKILLLVLALFFVFNARRHWDDKVFRFMAWGNASMFLFSCLSYLFTFLGPKIVGFPELLSNSLMYYQLGIFLELVFFLAGLSYKNKMQIIEQTRERERLKAENQMKEIEKELAVLKAQQEERNRISIDMHDELGSGMTAIRLMSELAKTKMKESSPVEIDKISDSANDVLNKMNAIIWSMNSGNDTLDNLVSYIRVYALEYFENTPINCKVNTPGQIEQKELTGDKRRNIFLCVKETLNNALKHSGATEIKIDIEVAHQLVIRIQDNGKGIDLQKLRQFGNGLKNIQTRMSSIDGTFSIENKNGTLTTLILPLKAV